MMRKDSDSQMPVNNGGINAIDKNTIKSYSNKILMNAQKNCQERNQPIESVKTLKQTVERSPDLKISLQTGLKNIAQVSALYGIQPNLFFQALNKVCIGPPKFEDSQIVGLPFFSLFIDLINTRQGQTFFLSQKVNGHLKEVLNQYNQMLNSQVSLKYMNQQQPHGWLCKTAFKYINYDEYYIDKFKPHWGFKSWNDWFTRPIRPQTRPIDQLKNSIVHSSDSYPYYYNPEQKRKNPCGSLKKQDVFWLKDNHYSLYDTLGARKMGITQFVDDHFVGGTIYQAFLGPWCYHRWHSPLSGTILKSYFLKGKYFYLNPDLESTYKKTDFSNYVDLLPMFSAVSTRYVFIIRLDDGSDRYVALIEIGLTETSSCKPIVKQGDKVTKGQQLGRFQYGGSSYALIFDKKFDLTFNLEVSVINEVTKSTNKQLVNSWLCTYT